MKMKNGIYFVKNLRNKEQEIVKIIDNIVYHFELPPAPFIEGEFEIISVCQIIKDI